MNCSRHLALKLAAAIVLTSLSIAEPARAQCTLVKFTPSDGGVADQFGASVSLSAGRALVGSPDHDDFEGGAYVFTWDSQTWHETFHFTAPALKHFGRSVVLL